MEISIPAPPSHLVVDYDIVLDSGVLLSYTLDPEKGDTVTERGGKLLVFLAEKTSRGDPTKKIAAEEIEIYVPHIMTVTRRERQATDQTVEDQLNWLEAFKAAGAAVN